MVKSVNRLGGETSPYLRQHADNPVHWYAWGDEAFAAARERDVPILLSIGYSSCHWCHVMAHESFEDPGVAGVMNELFVNVKVDREERPDVDAVYMQAVQAMTGSGGWPLTVFLTPDGHPFFGGTYFPKEPRHGLPGFVELLRSVHEAWVERRPEVADQGGRLVDAIGASASLRPSIELLSDDILHTASTQARSNFDERLGGFGHAPKFPQAMLLDFLLNAHVRNGSPETLEMVTVSLDAMAAGGIYDQVGGGFHRYSTDAAWLVPHFEKMLYDQALLTRAYLHAYQVTGNEGFRRIVEETIGYVLRDLRHPDGGFFSAEDADSEGFEGKFYVWSVDELREVCGEDADAVVEFFGVTPEGNFEGSNILNIVADTLERPAGVERALPKLFECRRERVRPGLDDKVLAGWNGLFLDVLGEAAAVLGRDDWLEAARANARFLLTHLRRDDGRLLRSWHADGGAPILGYAEDHAALLGALVTMAEVDGVEWLTDAASVADSLLDLFLDEDHGGFFTTGGDAQALVVRAKDVFDNATPSENSLAARGLMRLHALTGEGRYEQAAVDVLRLLRDPMSRQPTSFAYLLTALEWHLSAPLEIAIVGEPGSDDTRALRDEAWRRHLPVSIRMAARPGEGGAATPLLADRSLTDGAATAFVCERFACKLPVTTADGLRAQLDAALRSRS
ncbi:MAG: thioredoxin domain-containing protein [Actinobacteria bacterium]|nr:thioredoxin domain-containing protein [Actinomycetota bacterium]